MIPDPRFVSRPNDFWAYVRSVSQSAKYSKNGLVSAPTAPEICVALQKSGLHSTAVVDVSGSMTPLGQDLVDYLLFRANTINGQLRQNLMNAAEAKSVFEDLWWKLRPQCKIPKNKQKGAKGAPAYFTGIVNMLVEAHSQGMPHCLDPQQLTAFEVDGFPFRTLARRVDGCFPSPVNPIAIWEIKEYYYTTSFGSRVADGVYETLLDGLELNEFRQAHVERFPNRPGPLVCHYLMIDARDNWWEKGKSYLCRILDMLHMGAVDEVLCGREVLERLPSLVESWVRTTTWRRP